MINKPVIVIHKEIKTLNGQYLPVAKTTFFDTSLYSTMEN